MYEKFGQFIDGKWQQSSSGETYEVINPATEEIIGKASKANSKDIQRALKSAEKGLEIWKNTSPWERSKVIRKISEWPKCIETSINKLEPHRIPVYLHQLSSIFHSYWNMGRNNSEMRFLDSRKNLDLNKAILLKCILLTIKNGMNILGVSTPEEM